jgi:aryl-alcohol dehydrogenase-like predicted oxidoreductase/histidinol phosphatase-like enzyme
MTQIIGLGCMRLSTAADRDDARSVEVIHCALDAGATLLDTADAYAHDDHDIGHNERLIAAALRQWNGDASRVVVATKGGLRRPRGAWVSDGRGKHLRAACEASAKSLGVSRIALYQLHAVDPATPLETSVRALATLQKEGVIDRVGLCNVTVDQIAAARAITEIASVQVSVSVFDDENLRNGVAEYCREHGMQLIAHRPLGGERARRLARDPLLARIAAEHDATAAEVALAWLIDLGLTPIPGATRLETAASLGRAAVLALSLEDRARLDARFNGRLLRIPRKERRPSPHAPGEVVIVMGMPASGKSTVAGEFESRGHRRLNRDERGGSVADLVPALDAGLAAGTRAWVLDNTYPTRAARNEVIECAWTHGVNVRCVWMTTDIASAQVNAVRRMIGVLGRLPTLEDLRLRGKSDPRFFGPDAQFRFERSLEPPVEGEGFVSIERRPFRRDAAVGSSRRVIVLEFDEVLVTSRQGKGPVLNSDDVAIAPGRRETLRRFHDEGWRIFAHAWRPQIASGVSSLDAFHACAQRVRDLLALDIAFGCCPHPAGPPVCWCRKPLPGLVLEFAEREEVDLARSIAVGRAPADRTLADKLGMTYQDGSAFFR